MLVSNTAYEEPSIEVLDALLEKALRPIPQERTCKFGAWINSLPEEKQTRIQAMLTSQINHADLARLLEQVVDVSRDTIRTHRQGRCSCRK
jgi:hypothetical protein